MISSMTGFGDAEHSYEQVSFVLEIRSVNHRYFKAMIKLPEWLQSFEPEVEKVLRSKLGRGSITYHLKTRNSAGCLEGEIDTEALKTYVDKILPAVQGTKTVIDVGSLLTLPGVYNCPELNEQTRENYSRIIEELTNVVINKLLAMRRDEGRALARDLLHHSKEIRTLSQEVAKRAPEVVVEYQTRLKSRIDQLLAEIQIKIEQNDLLREIAIFAERCDISEEVVRLNSHLDQFEELCNSNEYAGRKLDFVAQEMLREVNTIGSKANDTVIARHVVEMKGLIDRLKEQVQNVE